MFFDASKLSTPDSIFLLRTLLVSVVFLFLLLYGLIPYLVYLYRYHQRHLTLIRGQVIEKRCEFDSLSMYIVSDGTVRLLHLTDEQFLSIEVGGEVEVLLKKFKILDIKPIGRAN